MHRGTHSFGRAGRSATVAALLLVALTGCSTAAGSGGDAPVAAESADAPKVQSVSPASGSLRGGTLVTIRGTGLSAVRSLRIAGSTVAVQHSGSSTVTLRTPAVERFVPGAQTFTLDDSSGSALSRGTYTYRVVDGTDAQLQYMLKYWKHYNPAYEALDDNDCVDFTSQGLLLRGWKQQGEWTHAQDVLASGAAWRSSTAFRDFMEQHPELGTPLTDQQRDQVKLGDVVQFDWDRSGDRDHTGVVTRIVKQDGKIRIYFAGHTNDSDYRSVDTAIKEDHPGGVAYYWSIK